MEVWGAGASIKPQAGARAIAHTGRIGNKKRGP